MKKIFKNPFVWAFFLGIASLHLIKELATMRRSAPPPMVNVGEWNLINDDGDTFGSKELGGKIYIADYFFTSCPSICPKLTNAMKEVKKRFKGREDQVQFVSITVDPTTDTPKVLKKFRAENNLDDQSWHLLTGSKKQIYNVVVEKMRVHMGEKKDVAGAPGVYDIPHMAHLALFDQNGDLRGLFKTENHQLAALVRAANFLLE
jgi:protein SCO1/2